jgi:hypothetical protein
VTRAAFERHAMIGIFRGHVPVFHWGPRPGSVARLARQRRDEVSRSFSFSCGAAVTAHACRGNAAVIHTRARECHRAFVTALARRSCDDVIWRLPECSDAIMATRAITDDAGMIHPDERKTCRALVTRLAGRVRGDVPLRFAGCLNPVVTICAAAGDSGMVEFCAEAASGSCRSGCSDRPARNTRRSIRP